MCLASSPAKLRSARTRWSSPFNCGRAWSSTNGRMNSSTRPNRLRYSWPRIWLRMRRSGSLKKAIASVRARASGRKRRPKSSSAPSGRTSSICQAALAELARTSLKLKSWYIEIPSRSRRSGERRDVGGLLHREDGHGAAQNGGARSQSGRGEQQKLQAALLGVDGGHFHSPESPGITSPRPGPSAGAACPSHFATDGKLCQLLQKG